MPTIEEYIAKRTVELNFQFRDVYYHPEVVFKIGASGKWFGYIWFFDGSHGQREAVTTGNDSILDCLVEIEKKVNNA